MHFSQGVCVFLDGGFAAFALQRVIHLAAAAETQKNHQFKANRSV